MDKTNPRILRCGVFLLIIALGAQDILPFLPAARAAEAEIKSQSPADFVSSPELIQSFEIPAELGMVEQRFAGRADQPAVFHIQDAHAVGQAQHSMRGLIEHLSREYAVELIAAEGIEGTFDTEFLRAFPYPEKISQALQGDLDSGELSGAAAAAILAAQPLKLAGLESRGLYLEGVAAYLDAGASRSDLEPELSRLEKDLNRLKEQHYSAEAHALDAKLAAWHKNSTALSDLLRHLITVQAPDPAAQPALAAVAESLRQDELQDPDALARELEEWAARIRVRLASREQIAVFHRQLQEFRIQHLSAGAFAVYLDSLPLEYEDSGLKTLREKFAPFVRTHRFLSEIRGHAFIQEFESYLQAAAGRVYRTAAEKRLHEFDQNLEKIRRLADLELGPAERPDLEPAAQADGIEAWAAQFYAVLNMPEFAPHRRFYQLARKRDEIFMQKLQQLSGREKPRALVLVTGGYHVPALEKEFETAGISYARIMPSIGAVPEKTGYRDYMRGAVSWRSYFRPERGRIDLGAAFARAMRDRLLEITAREEGTAPPALIREWRDEILRRLFAAGRIAAAPRWTRYLDELSENENSGAMPAGVLRLERFIDYVRGLDQTHRLNEKMLADWWARPANLHPYAIPQGTIPVSLVRQESAPVPAKRSEVRAAKPVIQPPARVYNAAGEITLAGARRAKQQFLINAAASAAKKYGSVNASYNPLMEVTGATNSTIRYWFEPRGKLDTESGRRKKPTIGWNYAVKLARHLTEEKNALKAVAQLMGLPLLAETELRQIFRDMAGDVSNDVQWPAKYRQGEAQFKPLAGKYRRADLIREDKKKAQARFLENIFLSLYDQGWTIRRIAEELEMHPRTITWWADGGQYQNEADGRVWQEATLPWARAEQLAGLVKVRGVRTASAHARVAALLGAAGLAPEVTQGFFELRKGYARAVEADEESAPTAVKSAVPAKPFPEMYINGRAVNVSLQTAAKYGWIPAGWQTRGKVRDLWLDLGARDKTRRREFQKLQQTVYAKLTGTDEPLSGDERKIIQARFLENLFVLLYRRTQAAGEGIEAVERETGLSDNTVRWWAEGGLYRNATGARLWTGATIAWEHAVKLARLTMKGRPVQEDWKALAHVLSVEDLAVWESRIERIWGRSAAAPAPVIDSLEIRRRFLANAFAIAEKKNIRQVDIAKSLKVSTGTVGWYKLGKKDQAPGISLEKARQFARLLLKKDYPAENDYALIARVLGDSKLTRREIRGHFPASPKRSEVRSNMSAGDLKNWLNNFLGPDKAAQVQTRFANIQAVFAEGGSRAQMAKKLEVIFRRAGIEKPGAAASQLAKAVQPPAELLLQPSTRIFGAPFDSRAIPADLKSPRKGYGRDFSDALIQQAFSRLPAFLIDNLLRTDVPAFTYYRYEVPPEATEFSTVSYIAYGMYDKRSKRDHKVLEIQLHDIFKGHGFDKSARKELMFLPSASVRNMRVAGLDIEPWILQAVKGFENREMVIRKNLPKLTVDTLLEAQLFHEVGEGLGYFVPESFKQEWAQIYPFRNNPDPSGIYFRTLIYSEGDENKFSEESWADKFAVYFLESVYPELAEVGHSLRPQEREFFDRVMAYFRQKHESGQIIHARSEVRAAETAEEDGTDLWMSDLSKVDWSKVSSERRRQLLSYFILYVARKTPAELIRNPEAFLRLPLPALNGQTLQSLYDYYDRRRRSEYDVFSTVQNILFDNGYRDFPGFSDMQELHRFDVRIRENQREAFVSNTRGMNLEGWLELFETHEAGLYLLLAEKFPKIERESLVAILAERFFGWNSRRERDKRRLGALYPIQKLKALEKDLAHFAFVLELGHEDLKELLLGQIRIRIARYLLEETETQTGGTPALRAIDAALKWMDERLDNHLEPVPAAARRIYEALKAHYQELKQAEYQKLLRADASPFTLEQMEGVHYARKNGNILLGDEPGVGKTLQALGIAQAASARKVVVLSSLSLMGNWAREIEAFLPGAEQLRWDAARSKWLTPEGRPAQPGKNSIVIITSDDRLEKIQEARKVARFILVNYEALRIEGRKNIDAAAERGEDAPQLDESAQMTELGALSPRDHARLPEISDYAAQELAAGGAFSAERLARVLYDYETGDGPPLSDNLTAAVAAAVFSGLDGRLPDMPELSPEMLAARVLETVRELRAWRQPVLRELKEWQPDLKITDEVHNLRNPEAQWTRGFLSLHARQKVALSGTPLVYEIEKLWPLLHDLDPEKFPSYDLFRAAVRINSVYHADLNSRVLNQYMIRRTKDMVLDLEPVRIEVERVDLDPEQVDALRGEYAQLETGQVDMDQQLARYQARRQIALDLDFYEGNGPGEYRHHLGVPARAGQSPRPKYPPKYRAVVEKVKQILQKDPAAKIFIVTQFNHPADRLTEILRREIPAAPQGKIKLQDGWTADPVITMRSNHTPSQRQALWQEANENPLKRVFLSTDIATEGINLTQFNHVIFPDLPFTPTELDQAIQRAHRRGQQRQVTAHMILANGTEDQRHLEIIIRKRKRSDEVVGGKLGVEGILPHILRETDEYVRGAMKTQKILAELQTLYSVMRFSGNWKLARAGWNKFARAYSDNIQKLAAFAIAQILFLHLFSLHRQGEIDLKSEDGPTEVLFAPSGPATDLRALHTLQGIMERYDLAFSDFHFTNADFAEEMRRIGREEIEKIGIAGDWEDWNLVEDELPANRYDFVINSELLAYYTHKNSKGVSQRNWMLGQLVRTTRVGGHLLLWLHNGRITDEAKEFLREHFGLELVSSGALDLTQVPPSLRKSIRQMSFVLARKTREVEITPEYLRNLPEDGMDVRSRRKISMTAAPEIVQTITVLREDETGRPTRNIVPFLNEGSEVVHIAQPEEAEENIPESARLLGDLMKRFIEVLDSLSGAQEGAVRAIVKELESIIDAMIQRNPNETYLKSVMNQLEIVATLNIFGDHKARLQELLAKLKARNEILQDRPVRENIRAEKKKRKPGTGEGRNVPGPQPGSQNRQGAGLAETVFKGRDLLGWFAGRGYRFLEVEEGQPFYSPDIALDEENKIFWVNSSLAARHAGKRGLNDLGEYLNLRVHFHLDAEFPEHRTEAVFTGLNRLERKFDEWQRKNRDFSWLENYSISGEIFIFFLRLRSLLRENPLRGTPARFSTGDSAGAYHAFTRDYRHSHVPVDLNAELDLGAVSRIEGTFAGALDKVDEDELWIADFKRRHGVRFEWALASGRIQLRERTSGSERKIEIIHAHERKMTVLAAAKPGADLKSGEDPWQLEWEQVSFPELEGRYLPGDQYLSYGRTEITEKEREIELPTLEQGMILTEGGGGNRVFLVKAVGRGQIGIFALTAEYRLERGSTRPLQMIDSGRAGETEFIYTLFDFQGSSLTLKNPKGVENDYLHRIYVNVKRAGKRSELRNLALLAANLRPAQDAEITGAARTALRWIRTNGLDVFADELRSFRPLIEREALAAAADSSASIPAFKSLQSVLRRSEMRLQNYDELAQAQFEAGLTSLIEDIDVGEVRKLVPVIFYDRRTEEKILKFIETVGQAVSGRSDLDPDHFHFHLVFAGRRAQERFNRRLPNLLRRFVTGRIFNGTAAGRRDLTRSLSRDVFEHPELREAFGLFFPDRQWFEELPEHVRSRAVTSEIPQEYAAVFVPRLAGYFGRTLTREISAVTLLQTIPDLMTSLNFQAGKGIRILLAALELIAQAERRFAASA